MAASSIENRIAAVEAEISAIKEQLASKNPASVAPWWERLAGAFEDDPVFDSAMARGVEYRRAQPTAADQDS
jgi:hypothetical protein